MPKELPGMEQTQDPKLEALATAFIKYRGSAKLEAGKRIDAEMTLLAYMADKKIPVYEFGGRRFVYNLAAKVKVEESAKDDDDEGGEE